MSHLPVLAFGMLLVVTVLGAWLDIQEVEVSVWLTFAGTALGIGLNLLLFGVHGLIVAGAGLSLAVATYFALHFRGVLRFSRVKLMAAVGSIVGPWNWLLICLFAVIFGIPIAIVVAFSTIQLRQTGRTKGSIVREFLAFLPPYHVSDHHLLRSHRGLAVPRESQFAIVMLFFLATTAVWLSR